MEEKLNATGKFDFDDESFLIEVFFFWFEMDEILSGEKFFEVFLLERKYLG
jgi:hypothetical protein